MRENNVSSRYARALYLLTEMQSARTGTPLVGQLERTLEDLRGFAELVKPGSRIGDFLTHPQVTPNDRRRLLDTGLKGRAIQSVVVFADLLLRKKRLLLAGDIARHFATLVERAKGLERALVVSAVPLTKDELARLHGELERTTGKKIVLTTEVDPALVGGASVRIGDRVIDRSVKSLLGSLAQQLYEVSV